MVNQHPSVLIVDDEQVVCDLLYDELNEWGYQCTVAFDGNEALAKLLTQEFQVVLLDIKLPGTSGMEVLRKIRSDHHNTSTIMITAVNEVDTAVEAMTLGATDYIVKPFDLDRVYNSICAALWTKQAAQESSKMDAIAWGVEARYDLLLGHSKIVTQETIDIARRLGIAEKEIQRWVAARKMLDSQRDRAIKSSLSKLERSPLAQSMMGIAVPYRCPLKPDESQN